jgi:gliding motility-associated-like protein
METDYIVFAPNAFTPDDDGDNDFFYIGNLEKYPDNNLKIYNRYGKQIYSATNYDNLWNGTYLGNLVPTGTYFYIFNDGKGEQYKGSVTILR